LKIIYPFVFKKTTSKDVGNHLKGIQTSCACCICVGYLALMTRHPLRSLIGFERNGHDTLFLASYFGISFILETLLVCTGKT
jgi:hypothetical protein